jgi:hypothetical protein
VVWAERFELDYATDARGLDRGLAREAIAIFRDLPQRSAQSVLLCVWRHRHLDADVRLVYAGSGEPQVVVLVR